MTVAKATAPLAAAALRGATGSYTPVLLTIAVGCAVAAGAIPAGTRRTPRQH
jgi:hypothetical protein